MHFSCGTLIVALLSAISLSFPIQNGQWDRDLSSVGSPKRIVIESRGVSIGQAQVSVRAAKYEPPLEANKRLILVFHQISLSSISRRRECHDQSPLDRQDVVEHLSGENPQFEPQSRSRMQRRSTPREFDGPPDSSTRAARMESSNPTQAEMRQILSDEEVDEYIEHWRAGKEYLMRLYYIEKGYEMTEEEEMEMDVERESYNTARRLEEYVKGELVRAGKARPKLVHSYINKLRNNNKRYVNARQRREELERLVEDEEATPDELQEYEKIVRMLQVKDERSKKLTADKRKKDQERMEWLARRVADGDASDEEEVEYVRKVQKKRDALDRKIAHDSQKRREERSRREELEKKMQDGPISAAEHDEYQKLLADYQAELAYQSQAKKKYYARDKERIKELEGLSTLR